MAFEYLSGGTAVSNQTIRFRTAATLNGSSLYMVRVKGLAADSVLGATGSYGIWNGSGKTGTRKTVINTGVPGSSAEVLWDLQSGRVYWTQTGTVYAYYYKYADLLNEGRAYTYVIPQMIGATAADVMVDNCPHDVKFGEYSIGVCGNRPASQALVLTLHGATGGNSWGATLTLGATAGVSTNGYIKISNGGASLNTANKICLRSQTGAKPFSGVQVTLREKME